MTISRKQSDYTAQFDKVEARVGAYAAESARISNDPVFSATGISAQLAPIRDAAYNETLALVATAEAWSRVDHQAIAEVLDGPEPPQSGETLAALAYQQQLVMRKYPAGPDWTRPLLDELADAVSDGDAIRAQVLADVLAATPSPPITGQNMAVALTQQSQRAALAAQAISLRATGERAAALALLDVLDGSPMDPTGVDVKTRVIRDALGVRLSHIDQHAGVDRLAGSFTLAFPAPLQYLQSSTYRSFYGSTYGLEQVLLGVPSMPSGLRR